MPIFIKKPFSSRAIGRILTYWARCIFYSSENFGPRSTNFTVKQGLSVHSDIFREKVTGEILISFPEQIIRLLMWSESEIFWCGFTFCNCDRSEKNTYTKFKLWQNKYFSLVGKRYIFLYLLCVQSQNLHRLYKKTLFVVFKLKFLISSDYMDIKHFS